MADGPQYDTREPVDFVVIGSGSAGGIIAKELAEAGFEVVVLEQGPYRRAADFLPHDEIRIELLDELLGGGTEVSGQTFRDDESKVATRPGSNPATYVQGVGGSSVHFSANFWRLREVDFREGSMFGPVAGADLVDWPITSAAGAPSYPRVEWEMGVAGAPGPNDSFRSRDYPMPPMPLKSSGALLEKAGLALGLTPQVAPVAVNSTFFNNRPGCIHCGYCMAYGCEANAKSSTLATMIPLAEATGNCEIRDRCAVFCIETDEAGRATEVLYYDPDGNEVGQKTRAVVLSANGAETPRLLFMSESSRHPDGLANSSGYVGRNLMFNGHSVAMGVFEHELNDYKSVQCSRIIHDFYETDPARGFYGGGGIDARPLFSDTPISHALAGAEPGVPSWGAAYKAAITHNFPRQMAILGSTTSLARPGNNITLDPDSKDRWGRPAIRVTYRDHDDDLAMASFLQDRAMELFDAAGALKSWRFEVEPASGGSHLLGTCRMGDDPERSVVNRYNRTHDVPNLFICDGSSLVTSGRGQPTMTIMALAFRTADSIKDAATRGEI